MPISAWHLRGELRGLGRRGCVDFLTHLDVLQHIATMDQTEQDSAFDKRDLVNVRGRHLG